MATLKVTVNESDHIQGEINAPITLAQYGDYQCPGCRQAYPIVKQVQQHFGKKLRFVFRNFPLNEIHPFAEVAAETAEFSGAHNKFWEMHDLIYENQDQLGIPLLLELAAFLKLDQNELKIALQNGIYRGKVKSDFLSGIHSGVPGTPTFFINNKIHNGSYSFEDLVAAIEQP
jgi:protein-disulfide isomerase